jgi:hypothetical protein
VDTLPRGFDARTFSSELGEGYLHFGSKSLTLDLLNSEVKDLMGLDKLTGLTSLTLNLSDWRMVNRPGFNRSDSEVKDLSSLSQLRRLVSVNVCAPLGLVSTFRAALAAIHI